MYKFFPFNKIFLMFLALQQSPTPLLPNSSQQASVLIVQDIITSMIFIQHQFIVIIKPFRLRLN